MARSPAGGIVGDGGSLRRQSLVRIRSLGQVLKVIQSCGAIPRHQEVDNSVLDLCHVVLCYLRPRNRLSTIMDRNLSSHEPK